MVRRKRRSQAQELKPWQRESFWRSHISDWKRGGLSKSAYCIKHQLTLSTFQYWYRSIQEKDYKEAQLNPKPTLFKRLELVNTAQSPDDIDTVNDDMQMESVIEPSVGEVVSAPIIQKQEKTCVEITFPNGIVLRTDDGCAAGFLTGLFQALKE